MDMRLVLVILRMSLISLPGDNPSNVCGRHLMGHLVKPTDTISFELAYHPVFTDFLDMGLGSCFPFCAPFQHQEAASLLCVILLPQTYGFKKKK